MGSIKGRAWSALLAAGLIASLAGCISSKPLDEVPTLQALDGRGAAVLRVAYDRNPERGDTETSIISVRVNRVSGGSSKRARLVSSSDGTYFAATMGGVLEPGTYSVYVVEMLWEGEKRSLHLAEDALQFEVQPDSISVIGTLVISRDGGETVYLSPQADAAAQWVGQAFPVTGQADAKTDYSPKVSTKLSTPRDAGAELKKRAQATASWVQLPSGDFAAPGRLGTVLYRHRTTSRNETIDVGTWSTVLCVGAVKNGVVAAGEEGLFRFSADGRTGWRQLREPARGAIHAVQAFGEGKVATTVRSGDKWRVFVTDDLFSGQWRELAALSFESINGLRSHFVPFALATPGKMGIVQFDGSYQIVDLRSGKVATGSLGQIVRGVNTAADGAVVVKTRASTGVSLSADGGVSWQTVNTPLSTVLAAVANSQTHYAIVSESTGGQISGFGMHVSRDGGLNWARTGTVPIRLGQAEKLWAFATGTLQMETTDAGVLESRDEGKTWARLPQAAPRN